MPTDKIKEEILTRLKARIEIYRVILFGSFSTRTAGPNSDIDLLVVTDDETMPQNFKESMANYHKVSSALGDMKKKYPIDLIVHTKPMHEKFIMLDSLFSRELTLKGEVLYEKN